MAGPCYTVFWTKIQMFRMWSPFQEEWLSSQAHEEARVIYGSGYAYEKAKVRGKH